MKKNFIKIVNFIFLLKKKLIKILSFFFLNFDLLFCTIMFFFFFSKMIHINSLKMIDSDLFFLSN